MANHTTLLFLSVVVLSIVTIARCSWISGGAPPPASVGDYMELGDDLIDFPSPSPKGDFIDQGKEEVALTPGPGGESQDGPASGPADEFMIQGKRYIWEGFGGVGGDFINQGKETVTPNSDTFVIQGKVYCDPCRIQFPTKISYPLPNTKIVLTCHKEGSDVETYRVEGTSDEKGKYSINAVGDHAEEICEITVSESPDPKCPELMDDENHVRVSLTNKHGIKGRGRFANPLGFMVVDADPRCKEALDELGFTGM